MNQAEVSKLVSKLRINVKPERRRLRNPQGPEGRLNKLRKTVTGLIKYERIELNYNRADEARQYAERLISEAIRNGDCHKPTMDIADYWLLEKELVHKLFKVLAPRFENCNTAFTKMYKAPNRQYSEDNKRYFEKAVLELRGNPYPSLVNNQANNKYLIQNILLDAAKQDYRKSKYAEIAENIGNKNLKTSNITSHPHQENEKSQLFPENIIENVKNEKSDINRLHLKSDDQNLIKNQNFDEQLPQESDSVAKDKKTD